MPETTEPKRTDPEPLLRQLSVWGLWLLMINGMIGAGISGVPAAGEARRPEIDMPRALLWALATCALLYALIQAAAQQLVPDLATAPRPLVQADPPLSP